MNRLFSKVRLLATAILLACAIVFTGCGAEEQAPAGTDTAAVNTVKSETESASATETVIETKADTATEEKKSEPAAEPVQSEPADDWDGYAFTYNNVVVRPNDLMAPLETALGPDYKYYESPSCAYIGLDKCYVYSGFSIYTYPDDAGIDHVLQIVLTDDSISTPEGLILGATMEKAAEIYGSDYEEVNGSYAYIKGKTSLQILGKKGRVSSIQYWYDTGVSAE